MAQGSTASVLRRKTARPREAEGARPSRPSPASALADAIRRVAEQALSLAAVPAEPQLRRATPDEIVEGLPEHAFLGLLAGPAGGTGLVCLDPGALSAIIEMRTIGRVTSRPPLPRRPTRTDAAMTADVIDAMLAAFEAPLAATEDARWASGWRFQSFLPEPRPVPVMLEEAPHRVIEVDLSFGAAGKPGRLLLALPAAGRAVPLPDPEPEPGAAQGAAAAAWRRAVGEAVEGAEASLGTVLGRVRLALADLAALAPGDRIAFPLAALGAVLLTGPGGVPVATGRLGQSGGLRAVRIGLTEAPAAKPAALGEIVPAGTLGGAAPMPPPAAQGGENAHRPPPAAADPPDAALAGIGGGIDLPG
ncbi:MAG: FliM/FliN family flagellar motor switch protein [Rhodobacteraceae bacterium]|nr:FliM/FliN family flagellar motor switch protein [Paracoccaceae bacterium]